MGFLARATASGGRSGRTSGRGEGNLPDLSRDVILGNMQDPPDKKRMRDLDRLARQAAGGDAEALERLHVLGALPGYEDQYGSGYGAATRDGRNYARYLLESQFGENLNYLSPGDAYVGDEIGEVAKLAGPVLGAVLPGVGMLGAAAIGAGSTAAGDIAQTGRPSIKNALLAGGLSAAGNSALGNGLGSTSSALPGVPGTTTAATGAAGIGGDAVAAGAASGAAGAVGAVPKASSFLGGLGDAVVKYAPTALGVLGSLDAAGQYADADRYRQQAMDLARQQWTAGGPARDQAMQRIMAPLPERPDLTQMYQSPNPYARPVPRG